MLDTITVYMLIAFQYIFTPCTLNPTAMPGAPADVTLHVTSGRSLTVTFTEPVETNGAVVTRYKSEWVGLTCVDHDNDIKALLKAISVKITAYRVIALKAVYSLKGTRQCSDRHQCALVMDYSV